MRWVWHWAIAPIATLFATAKQRAEITATFDISKTPEAKNWLHSNDLDADDQCILRRLYTTEGRSRGYINGQSCTMQQLQTLGDMLTDIHSQHEHQSLLRRETHRRLTRRIRQYHRAGHRGGGKLSAVEQREQTVK